MTLKLYANEELLAKFLQNEDSVILASPIMNRHYNTEIFVKTVDYDIAASTVEKKLFTIHQKKSVIS